MKTANMIMCAAVMVGIPVGAQSATIPCTMTRRVPVSCRMNVSESFVQLIKKQVGIIIIVVKKYVLWNVTLVQDIPVKPHKRFL